MNGDKPAYPTIHRNNDGTFEPLSGGLTKREFIAMYAMQGMLSNPAHLELNSESIIKDSLWYADALLTALNNKQ